MCVSFISSETESGTKNWVQVVYLEGDSKERSETVERRKGKTEKCIVEDITVISGRGSLFLGIVP